MFELNYVILNGTGRYNLYNEFIKHEFEKFTIPRGFDIIAISNKRVAEPNCVWHMRKLSHSQTEWMNEISRQIPQKLVT